MLTDHHGTAKLRKSAEHAPSVGVEIILLHGSLRSQRCDAKHKSTVCALKCSETLLELPAPAQLHRPQLHNCSRAQLHRPRHLPRSSVRLWSTTRWTASRIRAHFALPGAQQRLPRAGSCIRDDRCKPAAAGCSSKRKGSKKGLHQTRTMRCLHAKYSPDHKQS
jgi:hypothetical protein